MKKSLRARRMARSHSRNGQPAKLNLVSLMDIFTILVFFLMVNNGDVEVLQADNSIELPESVTEVKPDVTLLIKVSANDLLVQGRKIADLSTMKEAGTNTASSAVIPALEKELRYLAERKPQLSELEKKNGRAVTIMGDQSMPYSLLKQVMTTCAKTDFRDISLAVNNLPFDESQLLPQLEMEI